MALLSFSDPSRWIMRSNHDDEPPPPYSAECTGPDCIVQGAPDILMPSAERLLPNFASSSLSQKQNLLSARVKFHTPRTSEAIFHLGPIRLSISQHQYVPLAYMLQVRSSRAVTLSRSIPDPDQPSSSRTAPANVASLPRATPLYDIYLEKRKTSSVCLHSKTKDTLFSEPSSKLRLRKTQGPGSDNVWELYYHRNHDFESLVGVPTSGSRLILFLDTSSIWRERGGKIVAEEERAGKYLNHRGLKGGTDGTRLPRIDISEGLDQRFVDLVVACWAAKACFP
jgi:hypothetical protein